MSNSPKVIILGGGIGGLVSAHELIKHGYKVSIYERNDDIGGQARSKVVGDYMNNRRIDINQYDGGSRTGEHSEYCWHMFGDGYVHLLPILKEIPTSDTKTVFDHLFPLSRHLYGRTGDECADIQGNCFFLSKNILDIRSGSKEVGPGLTLKDCAFLAKCWIIARTHNLEEYDNILWSDYADCLSPEGRKWYIDSPSIFLGMDTSKLSAHAMLDLMRGRKSYPGLDASFYALDGPIKQTWFDPWRKYLTDKGVKIHLNSTVEKIRTKRGKISSIMVNGRNIKGDIFINALDPDAIAKLLPRPSLQRLSLNGRQIQTQVLYYMDKRLKPNEPVIWVLPDTPWCIMVRPEGTSWNLQGFDLLSAGIGIWHKPGVLTGLSAKNCTREEIAEECWAQIQQSKGFCKMVEIDGMETPRWNIWESFKYDKGIDTFEPKFSNNINTLKDRPDFKDPIYSNLWHATAYSKTDMNIFCMESAAEAARRAVNGITKGTTKNDKPKF